MQKPSDIKTPNRTIYLKSCDIVPFADIHAARIAMKYARPRYDTGHSMPRILIFPQTLLMACPQAPPSRQPGKLNPPRCSSVNSSDINALIHSNTAPAIISQRAAGFMLFCFVLDSCNSKIPGFYKVTCGKFFILYQKMSVESTVKPGTASGFIILCIWQCFENRRLSRVLRVLIDCYCQEYLEEKQKN